MLHTHTHTHTHTTALLHTHTHTHTHTRLPCCPVLHPKGSSSGCWSRKRGSRTQPSTLVMCPFPAPSDPKRFIATSIHYAAHAVCPMGLSPARPPPPCPWGWPPRGLPISSSCCHPATSTQLPAPQVTVTTPARPRPHLGLSDRAVVRS